MEEEFKGETVNDTRLFALPIFYVFLLCFVFAVPADAQSPAPTHPVDGQYITEWLILGPFFPNNLDTDFLSNTGGEATVNPREGDMLTTAEGKTLTWKRYTSKGSNINLNDAVGYPANATVYAFCILQSDTQQAIEVGFGRNWAAAVWVNGNHYNSPRKAGPLRVLNCGAMPKELVGSQLFGHRKGAFTGATEERAGIFEAASGGTLLLDEIGEMPLDAQVHLLRVLQENEVQRVGETDTRPVDVRVIAMTNVNLDAEVKAGNFREDLYHRLSVFPIHIPALRERVDDIPLLAKHLLKKVCQQLDIKVDGFGTGVMQMLQTYTWPGNVRELQNEIYRAAALAPEGMPIETDHFSSKLTGGESLSERVISESLNYSESVAQFRRRLVENALDECNGNRTHAAKKLGMDRSNLIAMIRRLGLK